VREAPPEDPRPQASSRPEATSRATPPPLGEAEAERWLERVRDDPGRALRGHGGRARKSVRGSAW
jgi:hypothetical protein